MSTESMIVRRIRHFASDNYAGVCPEAWAALSDANSGHAPAYGEDQWTDNAADLVREVFRSDCEVYFVFNGTAANSLALSHLCQSYHSILCHELAHIETDECGAPEFYSNGSKILLLGGADGKLSPAAIEQAVHRRSDIHYPKPRVVAITQATEVGTVYTPAEISAISACCREHGLRLHMDGARFANAVASLGVSPAELTWKVGVDVLSLGASKNGGMIGEAVIFFNRALAEQFDYRCKQAGQLASKMRFLSAPWVGMLRDGAWLRHAAHANQMAEMLHEAICRLADTPSGRAAGLRVLFPRQANSVFAQLPADAIEVLRVRGWRFYTFIGAGGCRFMCSWDTRREDVQALAAEMADAVAAVGGAMG